MTSYTWSSLQATVAAALVQAPSPYTAVPPDFTQEFPAATGYAETRITRDLVLLGTRGTGSGTASASASAINLATTTPPTGLTLPVAEVESVYLVQNGIAYPYTKASAEFVQQIWPGTTTLSPSAAGAWGRFWAPLSTTSIIVAPTPDAAYPYTLTGLFTAAPLSASNTSTYISTNYGDLMFAAVMKFMSGALLRNYGAQADESPQAQSWEKVYAVDLLPGCQAEEARRRGLVVDDLRKKPA